MTTSLASLRPVQNGPAGQEDMPYLLTPGPLTTSRDTKLAMLADWGSRDIEFRRLIAEIREELLEMAGAGEDYECVLMQGSGTFAIEAVLGAFAPRSRTPKTLIVANGAYGERAASILQSIGARGFAKMTKKETEVPTARMVKGALKKEPRIETVFVVHCETTTGIVNPIEEIAETCHAAEKRIIVDAMSSFGALPINMEEMKIDVLVSSSNKCIEGVPGFAYAICKQDMLEESAGRSHSVVLDLFEQWQAMEKNGQFRFTPPTHALVAFRQALREHKAEGGVEARGTRYQANKDLLVSKMRRLGFETLLEDDASGPIIQTFLAPADPHFQFETFYEALRQRGFAIYPGKLTERDSFRIGTIGQIDTNVIRDLVTVITEVLEDMNVTNTGPDA